MSVFEPSVLFGPIQSRRMGLSLGVNFFKKKICNFNCVYCELGSAKLYNEAPKESVFSLEEMIASFGKIKSYNPKPEVLTVTGLGEPTLYPYLAEVVQYLKSHYPNLPLVLITNGTGFLKQELWSIYNLFDKIYPNVDAISKRTFQAIDRPDEKVHIEPLLESIKAFSLQYKGDFYPEVFIVPGQNNEIEALLDIKEFLSRCRLRSIQFNQLDRPGTVSTVKVLSDIDRENIRVVFKDFPHSIPERKNTLSSDPKQSKAWKDILTALYLRPHSKEELVDLTGKKNYSMLKDLFKRGMKKRRVGTKTFYFFR